MLKLFILSFLVSMLAGYLILRWEHLHARFTRDVAWRGSHKVHAIPVSRIGGISIFIGWLVAACAAGYFNRLPAATILIWIVCLIPVFLGGLAEDLTKRVGPAIRLQLSLVSAALAYILLGAVVSRVDVFGIDILLAVPAVAFLFTLLAVGGVAHALNIIDGLNGLASSVCLMALIALGFVAFNVSDWEILLMCGLGAGAVLGFHVWNYPNGRIFCGDGGAYFLGAYIAILSTLLVSRNPQVSAWMPLLLLLYPVWETVFSAYRRRILRGLPATSPDRLHLHTLLYQRRRRGGADVSKNGTWSRRNSDAAVSVMLLAGANTIPAVLWWSESAYLMAAAVIYIGAYLFVYRRLVRFGIQARKYAAGSLRAGGDVDFPTSTRSLQAATLAEIDGRMGKQLYARVEENDV